MTKKTWRDKTCDFQHNYNLREDSSGYYCVRGSEAPTSFNLTASFISKPPSAAAVQILLAGVDDQSWVNLMLTATKHARTYSKYHSEYLHRVPCELGTCYRIHRTAYERNILMNLELTKLGNISKMMNFHWTFFLSQEEELMFENRGSTQIVLQRSWQVWHTELPASGEEPNFLIAGHGYPVDFTLYYDDLPLETNSLKLTLFRRAPEADMPSYSAPMKCKQAQTGNHSLRLQLTGKEPQHLYCLNLSSIGVGSSPGIYYLFVRGNFIIYNNCNRGTIFPSHFGSCPLCSQQPSFLDKLLLRCHCLKSWVESDKLCSETGSTLPIFLSQAELAEFLELFRNKYLPVVQKIFIGLQYENNRVSFDATKRVELCLFF